MKVSLLSLLVSTFCLFSLSVFAASHRTQGFVDIGRTQSLYVDFLKEDQPTTTLVILNGLTYDTTNWDAMMPYLSHHGYSILRFDMRGQGRTLAHNGAVNDIIPVQDQMDDLEALLVKLAINGKVDILALSYGAGVAFNFAALHPERIGSLIAVSPYVGPDMKSSQAQMIKEEVDAAKFNPFFTGMSDVQLYKYFMRQYWYSTAGMAEPVLLTNSNLLESTLQMTEGLWIDTKSIAGAQVPQSVHYIIADQDQYNPQYHYNNFWKLVPASAKASRININGSEHKIPGAIPAYASAWVNLILAHDPRIANGATFTGDAANGTAVSGKTKISLPNSYWWPYQIN